MVLSNVTNKGETSKNIPTSSSRIDEHSWHHSEIYLTQTNDQLGNATSMGDVIQEFANS